MSQMILYHGEPNGPSLVVLSVLFESGLDIETRHIDLLKGERHTLPGLSEPLARDMDVEGEGPVLVVDGEAMTDSVFIAQYLDEVSAAGLQPADPFAHWQMLMWCRRMTERGSPASAFLGCRANTVGKLNMAALDHIVSEDLRRRWQAVQAGDFPEEQVADSLRHVGGEFGGAAMMEAQLADGRTWLMGEGPTIADFATFGWEAGMIELYPDIYAGLERTAAWNARMKALPSVQRALSLATLADPFRHWAPGPEINRWG